MIMTSTDDGHIDEDRGDNDNYGGDTENDG